MSAKQYRLALPSVLYRRLENTFLEKLYKMNHLHGLQGDRENFTDVCSGVCVRDFDFQNVSFNKAHFNRINIISTVFSYEKRSQARKVCG